MIITAGAKKEFCNKGKEENEIVAGGGSRKWSMRFSFLFFWKMGDNIFAS